MAYMSYDKLWRSEFYNIVSAKDRAQDINLNQIKFKVNDTYGNYEKIKTNFKPFNDEDVINKAYLDTKLSKIDAQISYIQKDYNEFKLYNNKKSAEVKLIERAVKTFTQIL